MPNGKPTIAFIGFGEAGQAIANGLREAGVETTAAWDILFPKRRGRGSNAPPKRPACAAPIRPRTRSAAWTDHLGGHRGVERRSGAGDQGASCRHAVFLDVNSVSPGRKQETAKLLGLPAAMSTSRCWRRFIRLGINADAAGRSTRRRDRAPARALGMRVSIAGAETGAAAAIKMVRSVMIKGIEALTLECFSGSVPRRRHRRGGGLDEEQFPGLDWAKIVPYNLERMANHGERRAAEMEEVADTLRELGVEPLMTSATVKRQREMGQIGGQQSVRGVLNKDRATMLGAISAAARDRH